MGRVAGYDILKRIAIRGVVQGVGFRPFVFNLAERFGLGGWVLNNSSGVEIEAEGPPRQVEAFIAALRAEAPPLAHIESLQAREAPVRGYEGFEIRHSERQEGRYQLISPDIATCPDCLRELFDPADRRYRYPFINCTNCGPRFTIIADIPYDRPNTTMRVFPMCPDCQREYDDPRNRRFHAQPNACPVCGPRLELVTGDSTLLPATQVATTNGSATQVATTNGSATQVATTNGSATQVATTNGSATQVATTNLEVATTDLDVVGRAAALLREGAVLAVKGLGGFHLACDATNADAVRTLRARKRRPHKPFAVMMATLDQVERHCQVSPAEAALLASPQCPIVLLSWCSTSTVVPDVAPRYRYLGVMLPYTPLHHLLLHDAGRPLVMTSGNLSEEPIAAGNKEANCRLGGLADAFVLHNRDIHARYDDSVWFVGEGEKGKGGKAQPIRRARGYAPFPIRLPFPVRQILACGAEVKSTFCLTRDVYAFVSQHIGDMENLETLEHFERTIALYRHLFRVDSQVVAYDMHPDYLATRYALEQLAACDLEPAAVQHHHAHLAACLADNSWRVEDGPAIGVVLDGTGYGEDGRIWGGEWLVGGYEGYRRAGHLEYLPLPGGDAATRNPWRIAVSYLYTLLGRVSACAVPEGTDAAEIELLQQQINRRLNCPLTSSMGRLFDAVSALLGVCTQTTYEAQAAIELEVAASGERGKGKREKGEGGEGGEGREGGWYPFRIEEEGGQRVVRLGELFAALVADLEAGVPVREMAWRFHQTVARMTVEMCARIAAETGLRVVALSGGCFQNRLLCASIPPALEAAGFRVLVHRQVPCNDGGLSLGQAVVAHCESVTRLASQGV